jgi:hypothetical protein
MRGGRRNLSHPRIMRQRCVVTPKETQGGTSFETFGSERDRVQNSTAGSDYPCSPSIQAHTGRSPPPTPLGFSLFCAALRRPSATAGTKRGRSPLRERAGGLGQTGDNDECVCPFLGSLCGAWHHCRHSRDRRCKFSSEWAEFLPKALTATWWPLVSG